MLKQRTRLKPARLIHRKTLGNCPDCGVPPGYLHLEGCDVERCSVCGRQRLMYECPGHDRLAARWRGAWPK